MMHYDQLKRIEKNYANWLRTRPFFDSTKVDRNEYNKWALFIYYHKGMSHATKKEIATELGDVQLKWVMIDAEKQK